MNIKFLFSTLLLCLFSVSISAQIPKDLVGSVPSSIDLGGGVVHCIFTSEFGYQNTDIQSNHVYLALSGADAVRYNIDMVSTSGAIGGMNTILNLTALDGFTGTFPTGVGVIYNQQGDLDLMLSDPNVPEQLKRAIFNYNVIQNANSSAASSIDSTITIASISQPAGSKEIGYDPTTGLRLYRNVAGNWELREQYVNPVWWGAKGDGVTNDQAAIQAAFDYVKTQGGGTVFMSSFEGNNTYGIESKLLMPSNLIWTSDGSVTIKRITNFNDVMAVNDGWATIGGYGANENISVYNLKFDDNHTTLTPIGDILGFGHCTNIKVEGCTFINARYHSLDFAACDYVTVASNFFSRGNRADVQFDAATSSTAIGGILVDNTGSRNIIVDGNHFKGQGASNLDHISIHFHRNRVRNAVISNNQFVIPYKAIYFDNALWYYDVTITGNNFIDVAHSAIHSQGFLNTLLINGNTFRRGIISAPATAHIIIEGSAGIGNLGYNTEGIHISDNLLIGGVKQIYIDDAFRVDVVSNTITSFNRVPANYHYIEFNNVDQFSIATNSMYSRPNNAQDMISIVDSDEGHITSNRFKNSTGNAVSCNPNSDEMLIEFNYPPSINVVVTNPLVRP